MFYGQKHNYDRYKSTSRRAWRASISGLSNAIIVALQKYDSSLELDPGVDYIRDPVAVYAVTQAKRHRARGVSLGMFLGLFKYYRRSYVDLVKSAAFEPELEEFYLFFINRIFDRMEMGICTEWAGELRHSGYAGGLRKSEHEGLDEKNMYQAICENNPSPTVFLDGNFKIKYMNYSALVLFNVSRAPGAAGYDGCEHAGELVHWLIGELKSTATGNELELFFEKEFSISGRNLFFEVRIKRILGISGKFKGFVVTLNDITELKKAREKAEIAYMELHQIFNTAGDGMRVVDRNFNILRVNTRFSELSGVKQDDATGKKCYEVFPGSRCNTPHCTLKLILSGADSVKGEVEKRRLSGEKLTCLITATPLRSPSGQVQGMVIDYKDITLRKQAEERLFQEKERLAITLNSIGDGVIAVDGKGTVTLFNPVAEELTGYKRSEALGRPLGEVFKIVNEYTREPVENPVDIVFNTGLVVGLANHTELIARDGTRRSIADSAAPIKDPAGEIIGAILVFRDVTEQRRQECILKRYQLLSSRARDIILFIRPDGRIIEANEAAVNAYGYTREELLQKSIYDLRADHTLNLTSNQMAMADSNGILFETEHKRKDGSVFAVEVSSRGAVIGGERVLLSIIRDITERKAMEEALHQSNNMYRAIFETTGTATMIIEEDGTISLANREFEKLSGYSREELVGKKTWMDFAGPADLPKMMDYHRLRRIDPGKAPYSYEFQFIDRHGRVKNVIISVSMIPGTKKSVASLLDITNRKNIEEELKFMSLHDPLTGLYNRYYFEQEMRRLRDENPSTVGIIICDVDGLKLINDTLGHDAGDSLLKAAARVLKNSVGQNDVVARIGGDEFAILLCHCSVDDIEKSIQRINEAVAKYNASNPEIPLNISTGFAFDAGDVKDLSDLYKEADNNMYREKLHHTQSSRSSIVKALMTALEARDFITEGHADRLQIFVSELASFIGLPEHKITSLRLLAQFHDIGKVGIPDRILFKPGPLTAEEFAIMQRHCEIGYRIAKSAPDLEPIADWIFKHHEWWNGKGYPMGLKGEEIPLACRILSIADAFDAMTSNRPYRRGMSTKAALAELERCAGTQFDPRLVRAFIQILKRNILIADSSGKLD